jgi:NMD protein affecting ribosome stability and mRNA decay
MKVVFCDKCGEVIREEESEIPDLCEKCYREEMENEHKSKKSE